jgi:predicted nuclease of predicted toxin-antitoxin system
MKILLDTCVWGGVRVELEKAGYDVIWTGDWPEDPGDEEILAYAYREGRVLVTLDKDFGELAVVFRYPHAGIVRLVNLSSRQQTEACVEVLMRYGENLLAGAIITAERNRVRVRDR